MSGTSRGFAGAGAAGVGAAGVGAAGVGAAEPGAGESDVGVGPGSAPPTRPGDRVPAIYEPVS